MPLPRRMTRHWNRILIGTYFLFGFFELVWPPIHMATPYRVYGDSLMYVTIVDALRAPARLAHDYLAQHAMAIQPPAYPPLLRVLALVADGKTAALILQTVAALLTIFCIGWLARAWFPVRPRAYWPAAFLLLATLPEQYLLRGGTPRAFLLPLLALWLGFLFRRSFRGVLITNVLLAFIYPPAFVIGAACTVIAWLLELRAPHAWRRLAIFVGVSLALVALLELSQNGNTARYGPIVRLGSDLAGTGFGPGERSFEDIAMARVTVATAWAVRQALTIRDGAIDQYVLGARDPWPATAGAILMLLLCAPLLAVAARRGPAAALQTRDALRRRRWILLLILAGVSYALFFVARWRMMELYEPSRYLIVGALVIPILLFADLLERAWPRRALAIPLLVLLLARPMFQTISPGAEDDKGLRAAIDFCRDHVAPGDFLAGDPEEMDAVTMAGHAGVTECFEMAQPYHVDYWREYQRRVEVALEALVSADPAALERLHAGGARYLLVDRQRYAQWCSGAEPVFKYEPQCSRLAALLAAQGARPAAWEGLVGRCAVFDDGRFALLDLSRLPTIP